MLTPLESPVNLGKCPGSKLLIFVLPYKLPEVNLSIIIILNKINLKLKQVILISDNYENYIIRYQK